MIHLCVLCSRGDRGHVRIGVVDHRQSRGECPPTICKFFSRSSCHRDWRYRFGAQYSISICADTLLR
ncbi:hypothetical protein PILCRDRAFT_739924 [Piloderma croceum F 1598]|uniref:Uncharacterized protein n=1 Tax=Piloderma croceum (strain F 1598) TaxID=765440 RepID=A0A0C3EWZ1_PILCF|nr:hypothetical protein PILCRDRAFT_739924 [Piloderma croceum F 1598]